MLIFRSDIPDELFMVMSLSFNIYGKRGGGIWTHEWGGGHMDPGRKEGENVGGDGKRLDEPYLFWHLYVFTFRLTGCFLTVKCMAGI